MKLSLPFRRKTASPIETSLTLDGQAIEVIRKRVKNINLRLVPPEGRIVVSAPPRVSMAQLQAFIEQQRGWIARQRTRLHQREHNCATLAANDTCCWLWGQAYERVIIIGTGTPYIALTGNQICLHITPATSAAQQQAMLAAWYQAQLSDVLLPLVQKWQQRIGVTTSKVTIRTMRSRWGSCTPKARTIRFNSELAKKPLPCVEYVVVHELVHLLEASHNARFWGLVARFLPDWQQRRDQLNGRNLGKHCAELS